MANDDRIAVEVAYALADRQIIVKLSVVPDATVEEAIRASGLMEQFTNIDLGRNRVGVFGKLGKLSDTLHAGDRVEIYRPLIADPKEVRKRRAAEGG